jgi:hypothetical protein
MKFSRARTLVPKLLLTFATVAAAYSANAALDSLTVIRSILNASPMDVQLKLGKPDNGVTPSVDCDHLPSCTKATYQKGKFEALFYKDSLKWLEIKGNDLFDKNAPEVIGFSNLPPTFANSFTRSWRSAIRKGTATGPLVRIPGIDEIVVFPPTKANNNSGYMLITIKVNYDKMFTK